MRSRLLIGAASMLLCAGAASPAAGHDVEHIVGGSQTDISSVPWQVAVLFSGEPSDFYAQTCGGSLISSQWVLTAAHCVFSGDSADGVYAPSDLAVLAGKTVLGRTPEASGPRTSVAEIVVHPDYDPTNQQFIHDVALLRLAAPVDYLTAIAPIALPVTQERTTWPNTDASAIISGWGTTSYGQSVDDMPDALRWASVAILADPLAEDCGNYGRTYAPNAMLCAGRVAGGTDTCQGDSGGPLAVLADGRFVLAGITSSGNQCALRGFPGIYTRVTTYTPWIVEQVNARPLWASLTGLSFTAEVGSASAAQAVAIRNGGLAASTSSVVISGTNASEFAIAATDCGPVVDPAGGCTVGVIFTPTSASTKTAVLSVGGSTVHLDGSATIPQRPTVTGPVAPSAPGGLEVRDTRKKVSASWTAAVGASSYQTSLVGRNKKGKRVSVTQNTARTEVAFAKRLKKKSRYTVCVVARNEAGTSQRSCVTGKR